MEEWRIVPNTNGKIQVSNMGNVRSLLRGEPYVLKTQIDNKGYKRVRVTINRNKMTFKIHRLVANAFIPNPYNKSQVNHIDGDKTNNCVDNLEWSTNSENRNHAIKEGIWVNSNINPLLEHNNMIKKPVIAYMGDKKMRFESISSAEKFFNSRHISDVLKGRRKTVAGWRFKIESEVV